MIDLLIVFELLIVGVDDVDQGYVDHKVCGFSVSVTHEAFKLVKIVLVEAVLRVHFLLPLGILIHIILLGNIRLLLIFIVIIITWLILVAAILKAAIIRVMVVHSRLRMNIKVKLHIVDLCLEIQQLDFLIRCFIHQTLVSFRY